MKTLFAPNFYVTLRANTLLFAYFHVVIRVSKDLANVETSSHFKLLTTMVFNVLNFSILSQFFVVQLLCIITVIIVHSTKLLNFDRSRAVRLIPNCTP